MTATPSNPGTRRALLGGTASLLALSGCAVPMRASHDEGPGAPESASESPVARWMDVADRVGSDPAAEWPRPNTVALTARAMHDALNAVQPHYARWLPRGASEPPGAGASPSVAASMAAYTVLARRCTDPGRQEAQALLAAAIAAEPSESARTAGVALGTAIGTATLGSAGSTPPEKRTFPVFTEQGRWRPTPPGSRNSYYDLSAPFLFPDRTALQGPPPPDLTSARYLEDVEEVRRLGGAASTERSAAQAEAARFWVPQLLPRNLMLVLLRRLAAQPPRGGTWDEARMASILATAHADTDVIVYEEKAHYAFWRPVTAINLGSPGIRPDPLWQAMLVTPYHPDYPSGHSADLATGTTVIAGLLGDAPLRYQAVDRQGRPTRDFPSLSAMLAECSDSRIWAGAHFRSACNEGQRIGRAIGERALAQVPRVA